MAHQSQSQDSTTSTDSEEPTTITEITNAAITDRLFKDVDRSLSLPEIDNKPPLTLLADDTIDSSDDLTAADTTDMIDSEPDCSRTILVDTKALNRQKELDERYGG